MKRGWILSLGWLIWAGCMALLLPQRMRAIDANLHEAVRQHLKDTGFTDVDFAMDGQSVELRWRGDPATATDAQALRGDLDHAAAEAAAVRPGDWPFPHAGDWSDWITAPVAIGVADPDSVPHLPPPPPIVATEADPRASKAPAPKATPVIAASLTSSSAARPSPAAVSASASAAASCTDAVTVAISGRRLHFVPASAELTRDSDAVLDSIYKVVHGCPGDLSLEIDGYTDNVGPAKANLTLSFERARAAAAALVKRGLPQDMVNAHGFGEQNPVAANTSDAGRAANRRVAFLLRPGE